MAPTPRDELLLIVVAVEANGVHQVLLTCGEQIHFVNELRWDCSKHLDDRSGTRLIEEIQRRLRKTLDEQKKTPAAVVLSLPGTIEGETKVLRSTRLGIFDGIDIADVFRRTSQASCYVFHDVECLALGEARHGALKSSPAAAPRDQFAYILVDEGVGSALFIGGKPHRGAGSAGHLGRLIVEPDGSYNRTFAARGPLEVFAARPWVSANMVGQLLTEHGKTGEATEGNRSFRNTVLTASQTGSWEQLDYKHFAEGLKSNDPIAVSVLDDAARYLGLAINALITVANPPSIILGGRMVTDIPGFSDRVVSYARRFAWALAWNRTSILVATLGRDAQVYGAATMAQDIIRNQTERKAR